MSKNAMQNETPIASTITVYFVSHASTFRFLIDNNGKVNTNLMQPASLLNRPQRVSGGRLRRCPVKQCLIDEKITLGEAAEDNFLNQAVFR